MSAQMEKSPWLTEGEQKKESVHNLFSEVAPTYDRVNGLLSLGLHKQWRKRAVATLNLAEGNSALDACCGTGDFLIPLRHKVGPSGRLVGLDFCQPMLELAHAKDLNAELLVDDACALPFSGPEFDAYTVGWGLRNVSNVGLAIAEAFRVLKPGGQFVAIDTCRPSGPAGKIAEGLFHLAAPLIGAGFGKKEAYTYLPKSTLTFESPEDLSAILKNSGFTNVWFNTFFFGNLTMVGGSKP